MIDIWNEKIKLENGLAAVPPQPFESFGNAFDGWAMNALVFDSAFRYFLWRYVN